MNQSFIWRRLFQIGFAGIVCLMIISFPRMILAGNGQDAVAPSATGTAEPLVVRTYDLQDLLESSSGSIGPKLSSITGISSPQVESASLPEKSMRDIAAKIQDTIEYSSWNKSASIQIVGSKLVVTQTEGVQQKIISLLNQLREGKSTKLVVKYRLVVVEPGAAKNIAVRLAESAARTSAKLGGTFLGDSEADALVAGTEDDKNINVFQSSIKVNNGSGAYALQCEGVPYVVSVAVSAAGGHTTYTPTTAVFNKGLEFDLVRALVSADHHYVTMDVDVGWSRLESLETVAVANDPNLNYQRPRVGFAEMRSRVTVPRDQWFLATLGVVPANGKATTDGNLPVIYILIKPSVIDGKQS